MAKPPEKYSETQEAVKLFKGLLATKLTNFKVKKDFKPGNMLFYRYDAKDKEKVYDKTPLIIVLWKTKGYVLGLNLHWCPIPLRKIFLKAVFKINSKNIKDGLPLHIDYKMVKPLIVNLGLSPIIRMYIFSRISVKGLVVPQEMMMKAIALPAESFTDGMSAEQAYKQAIKKTKLFKKNRGRRDSVFKIKEPSKNIKKKKK